MPSFKINITVSYALQITAIAWNFPSHKPFFINCVPSLWLEIIVVCV